jgi:hypothetical protein
MAYTDAYSGLNPNFAEKTSNIPSGQLFWETANPSKTYTAAGYAEMLQNKYRQQLVNLQLDEFNVNKGVTLKNYEKGKAKTLSQIAQNAVSSGLSNTPILMQSERGYESEVGDPMRENLAAQYASIQKGIKEQNLQTNLNKDLAWINQQMNVQTKVEYPQETTNIKPTQQTQQQQQVQQQAPTGVQIAQSMNTGGSLFGGQDILPQQAVSQTKSEEDNILFGDSPSKPGNLISDAEWGQITNTSIPSYKPPTVSDIVKKSLGL